MTRSVPSPTERGGHDDPAQTTGNGHTAHHDDDHEYSSHDDLPGVAHMTAWRSVPLVSIGTAETDHNENHPEGSARSGDVRCVSRRARCGT